MFVCSSFPTAAAAGHTVMSRTALAIGVLILAGGSTLAVAQDVYSSGDGNTGQWNPQGPLVCQVHVDQYNGLTPQIQAAAQARDTETKNRLTKQRSQKQGDFQICVKKNRSLLLKGSATHNAPQEGTVDEYGSRLPAMTGTTHYGGVQLTVETKANRLVGQGISGPVTIVSRPAKFSKAEGYIQSSTEFRITRLWDSSNRPAYSSGVGIPVSITPK